MKGRVRVLEVTRSQCKSLQDLCKFVVVFYNFDNKVWLPMYKHPWLMSRGWLPEQQKMGGEGGGGSWNLRSKSSFTTNCRMKFLSMNYTVAQAIQECSQ